MNTETKYAAANYGSGETRLNIIGVPELHQLSAEVSVVGFGSYSGTVLGEMVPSSASYSK